MFRSRQSSVRATLAKQTVNYGHSDNFSFEATLNHFPNYKLDIGKVSPTNSNSTVNLLLSNNFSEALDRRTMDLSGNPISKERYCVETGAVIYFSFRLLVVFILHKINPGPISYMDARILLGRMTDEARQNRTVTVRWDGGIAFEILLVGKYGR